MSIKAVVKYGIVHGLNVSCDENLSDIIYAAKQAWIDNKDIDNDTVLSYEVHPHNSFITAMSNKVGPLSVWIEYVCDDSPEQCTSQYQSNSEECGWGQKVCDGVDLTFNEICQLKDANTDNILDKYREWIGETARKYITAKGFKFNKCFTVAGYITHRVEEIVLRECLCFCNTLTIHEASEILRDVGVVGFKEDHILMVLDYNLEYIAWKTEDRFGPTDKWENSWRKSFNPRTYPFHWD